MIKPTKEVVEFILSLAPPCDFEWIESDELFAENKLETEFENSNKMKFDKSVELSRASGQLDLYLNIYKPAMALFVHEPQINVESLAKQNKEIDELVRFAHSLLQVQECFGSSYMEFHPSNKNQTEQLMKFLGFDKDPYRSLFQSSEHDDIVQAICLVQDITQNVIYDAPEGFVIKHMQVPQWEPDKPKMQQDAFDKGYFTGPCGQWFYTPLCADGIMQCASVAMVNELKSKLTLALRSKLPAYQLIVEHQLSAINVTDSKITYMEKL